jgi:hypothetical protein
VVPPDDNLARRWLKLLLYLVTGAGFGETDADDAITLSEVKDPVLRPARADPDDGETPSSVREPNVGILAECVRGELAKGEAPRGDADSVGVLNGWTENELLRLAAAARSEFRELCVAVACACIDGLAVSGVGGELELKSWALRRADIGLVPLVIPVRWKVDKLPYASPSSGDSKRFCRRSAGKEPTSVREACSPAKDGLKRSSSAPRNLELNSSSESSIRKSQFCR